MIDRQKGQIVFECDSCPATLESNTDNFTDAWNKAKAEGWKTHKIGAIWVHACDRCEVDR